MASCLIKMAFPFDSAAAYVRVVAYSRTHPPSAEYVTPTSHVYGHLRLMTNLSGLRCIIPPPSDHVWRMDPWSHRWTEMGRSI